MQLIKLQEAIRTYGHLAADIYPLNDRPKDSTRIELSYYDLAERDLEEMPASLFLKNVPHCRKWSGCNQLLKIYLHWKNCFEFDHVIDEEEREWIQSNIENGNVSVNLSNNDKKDLLERLTKIEGFEKYIHRTFVGAKRFSIEGLGYACHSSLMNLFAALKKIKIDKMLIGMAHRGRLNVLTHMLNNPYEMFFALFAGVSDEPFIPKDGTFETYPWLVWRCRLSLRCNV